MLIPLRMDRDFDRRPFATLVLIAINVVVFAVTGDLTLENIQEIRPFALDPANFRISQSITSQFLHVNGVHLVGNMLALWVFGRYVEDRVGPVRYVVLYLLFGVAGDLVYLLKGNLPAVGASGAISGLSALVLFAAPQVRVVTIWFMMVMIRRWLMPAWLLMGFWLLGEVTAGDASAAAHIGGFLGGVIAQVALRQSFFANSGWSLALEQRGGEKLSAHEREMAALETTYKLIDEAAQKTRGPSDEDEGKVYDITL